MAAASVEVAACCLPDRSRNEAAAGSIGNAPRVTTAPSAIDLVDDGIDEGDLTDVSAGLNWYLNPNTRFMLNLISADLEPTAPAADGRTEAVVVRAQFNF